MLICIEGCLGVGKTTLVQRYAERVPCIPLYEDVANNPFLLDFYRNQERYALHVQYTFLLLQDRLYQSALDHTGKKASSTLARKTHHSPASNAQSPTIICDFHPLRSFIFASVVLPPEARSTFNELYRLLHIPKPDLIVYLRADEHTILARLRKRNDVNRRDIDFTYLTQLCTAYDQFFRTYQGAYVTVDTTHIDYVNRPQELGTLLQQIPLLFHAESLEEI